MLGDFQPERGRDREKEREKKEGEKEREIDKEREKREGKRESKKERERFMRTLPLSKKQNVHLPNDIVKEREKD